jgi:methylmalonyl-CoA mutase
MPEADAGGEILNLLRDFPPVPTSAWEASIAKDLKGADYDKKLVWHTEEGIAVCPYYRKEALTGLGDQLLVRRMGRGWQIAQNAEPGPAAIRADLLHEAGAHAIQELGYGIAAGVERLAEETSAPEIEFVFAAGPSYFLEIAKLRAARILWAQVVAAFGDTDCRLHLHGRTPRRNKSAYDCYTNLLRVTTEALSAVVGGCDSLDVEPFGFDPHLAANVQHILQEESHLDAVADPAGGSYYIEALTDSLAREAWKLLQQVEAEGGYAAATGSGSIDKALAETRAARAKAYSSRRRALVGVNNYPNLAEKAPEGAVPDGEMRIADPFEKIRRRTTEHAQATGRYPKVLLLTRGDVKMKGARANFCLNLLGCAGFDIVESEEYQGTDADLIVLCSSDAEYPAMAREVCPRVMVPVLVAGNPKEQIEALPAAGVEGFIHVHSDLIETLTHWQDKLGMRSAR